MSDKKTEVDKLPDKQEKDAKIVNLGQFDITYYCSCEKCCLKTDGITATGTKAKEGRTIAVDPDIIPLGSEVIIKGHTYKAEDVGGAIQGKRVDIFVESHQRALELGIDTAEIKIKE